MNTRTKAGRTSLVKARKVLTLTELFFFEHAGYSYDPKTETAQVGRIRCARGLALAEHVASELGWQYEWCDDWQGDHSCYEENEGPESCESCVLRDAQGKVLASLGCIDDADNSYRRVIEAELASEALAELNVMRVSAFTEPITA